MKPSELLPFLSIVLISCTGNSERSKAAAIRLIEATPANDSAETFAKFNERFHNDSTFQLSRIAFPIGGRLIEGENSREWTVQNWELLKEPVREAVDTKEYKHDLQNTDSAVIEKYWIEYSGFKIERRFKKIGGKWFLTYYDDINL